MLKAPILGQAETNGDIDKSHVLKFREAKSRFLSQNLRDMLSGLLFAQNKFNHWLSVFRYALPLDSVNQTALLNAFYKFDM